jgi:ribosomal protein L36
MSGILELFNREIAFLTMLDLLIITPIVIGIYLSVKYLMGAFLKYSVEGVRVALKPIKKLYTKNKMARKNKIICVICKNPLHKCTCKLNAGVPYKQRLKNWKINQKAHAIPKQKKNKEKPVELKQKTNGGK